jgi:hypothetical protein
MQNKRRRSEAGEGLVLDVDQRLHAHGLETNEHTFNSNVFE